jgi:hypothetical protein
VNLPPILKSEDRQISPQVIVPHAKLGGGDVCQPGVLANHVVHPWRTIRLNSPRIAVNLNTYGVSSALPSSFKRHRGFCGVCLPVRYFAGTCGLRRLCPSWILRPDTLPPRSGNASKIEDVLRSQLFERTPRSIRAARQVAFTPR